ncbi:MAG: hypothetical protein ACFB11_24225 [Paracoccaceae bacterium]
MTKPINRILRLSVLRRDAAERRLQAARLVLQTAEAHVIAAQEEEDTIRRRTEEQRSAAREAFVGAYHARIAVENMMRNLTSLDKAEEEAAAHVEEAKKARDAAKPPVAEARKGLLNAQAIVQRREKLVDQLRITAERQAELHTENETAEQWVGQQRFGGVR